MNNSALLPIEKVKCVGIVENPTSTAFDLLVLSIQEKGVLSPIYLDWTNHVLFGHYRFLAAKKAGLKEVPIRYCNSYSEVNLAGDK